MKLFRLFLTIIGAVACAVAAGFIVHYLYTGRMEMLSPLALTRLCSGSLLAAIVAAIITMRKTLSGKEIVPDHFQSALNGLQEGVVILDLSGRISYCNQQFMNSCGAALDQLTGRKAKSIDWKWIDTGETDVEETTQASMHWVDAIKAGGPRYGNLQGAGQPDDRTLIMQAIPIAAASQRPCGALISFQDVSKLHKKQVEASIMLETIRKSSQHLRQQNSELEQLTFRDSLSGCYHRRYGLQYLEQFWAEARREQNNLVCMVVDIDRFRRINESFGYEIADRVLRETGCCLMNLMRTDDLVCRYNGEQFLVIMPRTQLQQGLAFAEKVLREVSRLQVGDVTLTVSIGLAAFSENSISMQSFLETIEKRVAIAKQFGRNQICAEDRELNLEGRSDHEAIRHSDLSGSIPFPAVTALISALAYRDHATASHSRRVANLCVQMGQRLMSMSGCYILEMAALLHDIGKIGLPDETLLKSTPLSDAEKQMVASHDRIGLEIIRTSFATPELTEIVENYSRPYSVAKENGQVLPLGARILAVADAYDSMTNDQIYRTGRTSTAALAELQRCAGIQFDPEIVNHLAEVVRQRGRETPLPMEVNRASALAFGIELERLAEAVDQQDLTALCSIAGTILRTANDCGADEITGKAIELEQASSTEADLLGALQVANELLAYCRATQGTFAQPGLAYARPVNSTAPHTAGGDFSRLSTSNNRRN